VYFGLKHFSARAKVGFSIEELSEVMRTLHGRGVRGYVTFNTLIFDHEVEEAERTLAAIAEADADAVIVQDPGAVRMARRIAPWIEIHGSTQMSITSAEGVRYAQSLGVDRVTLARELSLAEIRAIQRATDCDLEIFVHGALCVAYSGQCFSSEAWGGRSANRGQCAQACRLPYEMLVDGAVKPLGDARYLLSPGDLYALHHVPEICEIGISTLKIEGRYKDADYVALTTAAYRKAVDEACAGLALSITPAEEVRLEQVYSRGLGPWFLNGTDHQAVVRGRAPRHRGVLMGQVVRVTDRGVRIEPGAAHKISPLKAGDGVVFDAADWRSPEEREEGGRIFEVAGDELRFANGAIDAGRVRPGDLVWRTHDPDVDKAVRVYTAATAPVRRRSVDVEVIAREGEPLRTVWSVRGLRVEIASEGALGRAENRAIDADYLRAQFGRLGGTAYELGMLTLDVAGAPFVPASVLNRMRREAVAGLDALAGRVERRTADFVPVRTGELRSPSQARRLTLHLLVRSAEQLDAAIDVAPDSITLDYLDLYGLKPSLARIRAAGLEPRVAAPRVLKPGEEKIADFLLSCECPILVRSTGLLEMLHDRARVDLIGDFSLNAANVLTAREYLAAGLALLTPSHDLNAEQIATLARETGADRIEAVAYQHLPVFHTEHCVFCRFLSTGTSYRDCGRPCEKHTIALRDAVGRAHPVVADVGCRNTVFGAEAQEASLHLESWREAGISRFRLEFAHESADQVAGVARAFRSALDRAIDGRELRRQIGRFTPQGVTQGSLFVPENYLTLPVLQ
jgi:putative protease